jgi:hypothetical protein
MNPSSETQFEVRIGPLVVGHIRKDRFSGNLDRWGWQLNATGPSLIVTIAGFADDLEGAKTALTRQRSLDLAGIRDEKMSLS